MNVTNLLAAFLPMFFVAAALCDLLTYKIPNIITGAIIALYVLINLAMVFGPHPLSVSDAGYHLLAGAIGLVCGTTLFSFGYIGGGDAKLFAAAALWLGWQSLFDYAVLSALLGGGLTLGLLLLRTIPLPPLLVSSPWLARLTDPKQGIPYGVALAAAAVLLWPQTELFRLAVAE